MRITVKNYNHHIGKRGSKPEANIMKKNGENSSRVPKWLLQGGTGGVQL